MGYLDAYTLPDCVSASGASVPTSIKLPVGTCVQIPKFTSFEGGIITSCPKGKTPDIKAYSGNNCDGTSVDAGTLPSTHNPGQCQEFVLQSSSGSVSSGAQSAKFSCI